MKNIYSILTEIREESSTNEKLVLLEKEKDNELLRKVIWLCYNKLLVFGIKQIPEVVVNSGHESLLVVLEEIKKLYNKECTGNLASDLVANMLYATSAEDAEVIKLIIGRDLKIGMGTKSINKIMGKGFIPKVPYMGAVGCSNKNIDKLLTEIPKNSNLFWDIKEDGRYCNLKIFKNRVELESRAGKPNYFGDTFNYLSERITAPMVLNGELLIEGYPRYEANGIFSSLVSIGNKILAEKKIEKDLEKFIVRYKMTYQEMLGKIRFSTWDIISHEDYLRNVSKEPRWSRLEKLEKFVKDTRNIIITEHGSFPSIEEVGVPELKKLIIQKYKETLKKGLEGLILKAEDAIWEDGKKWYQVKLKQELEIELEIVGFKEGKKGTRLEGTLGSLICRSSDGVLNTDPGGLSDEVRKEIWENKSKYLNTIGTFKSNGVSQDVDGNYSLLHPAFVKFRDDKDCANSIEEILEIAESSEVIS